MKLKYDVFSHFYKPYIYISGSDTEKYAILFDENSGESRFEKNKSNYIMQTKNFNSTELQNDTTASL